MNDEDWAALWLLVQNVAKNVARKYPGIDEDDLLGALSEFAVKATRPHLKNRLTPDDPKQAKHLLYRAAHIEAGRLRAEAYAHVVQYDYKPDDVRDILPYALGDPEDWCFAPDPEDSGNMSEAHGARMDAVLDVRQALDELGAQVRVIYDYHRQAGEVDISERKRYYRAVERVARQASRYRKERWEDSIKPRGYPGARRATSNARSRALIEANDSEPTSYDWVHQNWG